MTQLAKFVYSPSYTQYDFGPSHPFNPLRLVATKSLIDTMGLLTPHDTIIPDLATFDELFLIHQPDYIDMVQRFQTYEDTLNPNLLRLAQDYGLGTEDDPVFPKMHQAGSLAVGGTLTAARLVASGQVLHALNIAGGLHHAKKASASGFCIYNDVAIAIKWLREHTSWKIAYIDTDAHHGDGVQEAFYDDPHVLTISLHETGQYLFPGTGSVEELGEGAGYGFSLNLPLRPYSDDESSLESLLSVVPQALAVFQPDLIVSQHGCDGHFWDPLTDLLASTYFYAQVPSLVDAWAHQFSQGRWIAVGGGGYELLRVVPRAWTLLWAQMIHQPLANSATIPSSWLEQWQSSSPEPLPRTFLDRLEDRPTTPSSFAITQQNRQTVYHLKQLVSWLQ
ncbi:acetoin utilization protein AcuC [Sulfobacillus thermosulfidooxidans]|uniref:acetoin utilization protein AcuC n=1 Tax=Sulfobacillus thermosulfidooxidans TaxID=28034 RepID=UPI000401C3C1|nr:acetoin utilization protein AcuC [Sulfobacillus thermosulfidooxidans]